ncbi:MAG TPA: SPOR domain-containing protein [bacterium]|nr:SPOR domain-containing protein [bacterium]
MDTPDIAPIPDSAPVPLQPEREFRRQRLIAVLTLVLLAIPVSLVIGGFVGTGLMRSLSMASAANQARASQPGGAGGAQAVGGGLGSFFSGGGGIAFNPEAFPTARYGSRGRSRGGESDAGREKAQEESTDETPVVVEESAGTIDLLGGEPLLGGAAPEAPTADDSSPDASPEQETDAPAGDSPEAAGGHDLFDLGGGESGDAKPVEEPQEPPKESQPRTYRLYLGTFSSRTNADQLVSELAGKGVNARVRESNQPDGSVLFKVVAGGYSDKADADAVAEQLRAQGYSVWIS